jgi:hypothetical protein
MVARLVEGWRKTGKSAVPKTPERISPKHAVILVTRAADQMTEAQQRLFDRISTQCPDAIELRQIAGKRPASSGTQRIGSGFGRTGSRCGWLPYTRAQ